MSKTENTQTDTSTTDTKPLGVVAKLKKAKEAKSGDGSYTLPSSGVEVTFPNFINHGQWGRAQRLAKKDHSKAQTIYVVNVCKFDGEKITTAEFDALIPTNDSMELLAKIWGDDEEDDEPGKPLAH